MHNVTLLRQVRAFCLQRGVTTYLVGGCVRDVLLGRDTKDIDVAVQGNAQDWAQALAQYLGGRYVSLDQERDIARVAVERDTAPLHLDVTSYRGDIRADLARRDFTVDALAVPLDQFLNPGWHNLIQDPFGGRQDLAEGIIRAVGRATFEEDPCRLLRAVRLAAALGFRIEEGTEAALRRAGPRLAGVAAERLRDEFLALLATQDACRWLYVLDDLGLLRQLIPELEQGRGVTQPPEHYWDVLRHNVETVGAVEHLVDGRGEPSWVLEPVFWDQRLAAHFREEVSDGYRRSTLLKLGALLHDIAKPATRTVEVGGRIRFLGHHKEGAVMAKAVARRLRLSRRGTELVRLMVENHLRPKQAAQKGELPTQRAVYRYFRDAGDAAVDTLYLNLADYWAARGPALGVEEWQEHVTIITHILWQGLYQGPVTQLPRLVDGHDLMRELGLGPGPYLGHLLEAVREAQGAGQVTTRGEALAVARSQMQRERGESGVEQPGCPANTRSEGL